MSCRVTGLGLLVFIGVGCAPRPVVKVNTDVYRKSKFALASYYGPKNIPAYGVGLGSLFTAGNTWGEVIAAETMEPAVQRIEDGLHVLVNDIPSVLNSKAYLDVGATAVEGMIAPVGMKVLAADTPEARVALGKLAKDLDVEAVLVVRNKWQIGQDSQVTRRNDGAETRAMYGVDEMRLSIVGLDGMVLFEHVETCRGYTNTTSARAESFGVVNERDARDMVLEATLTCMDRFVRQFNAKRPVNIPLPAKPEETPAAVAPEEEELQKMEINYSQQNVARPRRAKKK